MIAVACLNIGVKCVDYCGYVCEYLVLCIMHVNDCFGVWMIACARGG